MSFDLEFGALFAYSPRGNSKASENSRIIRDAVKAGNVQLYLKSAQIIKEGKHDSHVLSSILHPAAILVPVPRSSLMVEGGLYPALKIAEALTDTGIGKEIQQYLIRNTAIPKSAFQKRGERPPLEKHMNSLTVSAQSILPIEIALVDDFITKGVTFYACALQIKKNFPNAKIKCFALVRTMGLVPDIIKYIDPCIGTITSDGTQINRSHSDYT